MSSNIWHVAFGGRDAAGTVATWAYATHGYVVGATSALGAEGDLIEPRVLQPGLMREDLYGAGRTSGAMEIGTGVIVLANLDGALDALADYNFDGSYASIYEVGENGILTGRAFYNLALEQPVFEEDKVSFQVREYRHKLDVDLLTRAYDGGSYPTGYWLAAPDDIAGTPYPALYGIARNFEPVCVDPVLRIYQVDGQRGFLTGWSLDVFDSRSPLTQGADYASQAAMEATAPSLGEYRVWPAGGAFRLASDPTGLLTCDGENPPLASPYNASTVSNLLRALSGVSLGRAHFDNDAAAGLYLREQVSKLEAVNRVASSLSAFMSWWRPSPAAADASYSYTWWASQLTPPDTPIYTPGWNADYGLTPSDIKPGTVRQVIPGDEARGLPIRRVNVRYRPNYRVMSATDVAGLGLADLVEVSSPYRTASAEDTGVLVQYPDAIELTVETVLDLEADAQAEADRLMALFAERRRMWSVTVVGPAAFDSLDFFRLYPGYQVSVTYPRFGLDAGVVMLVLGLEQNIDEDTYTVLLWG